MKNKIKIKTKYLLLISILLFINCDVVFTSQPIDIAKEFTTETETTRRKPKGSKVADAKFFDKMYDKNRIIITEGDGGNGEGGRVSGNKGTDKTTGRGISDSKKTGSNNIGMNNTGTSGGIGGKIGGGSQKSNKAEKSLRDIIDEARKESIANELATAENYEEKKKELEEKESIQESIRKAIIQESIKNKVYGVKPQNFNREVTTKKIVDEEITLYQPTSETLRVPQTLSKHSNNSQFSDRTKINISPEERNQNYKPQINNQIIEPSVDFDLISRDTFFDDNIVPTAQNVETVIQTKQNNGATIYSNNTDSSEIVEQEYTNYQNEQVSKKTVTNQNVESDNNTNENKNQNENENETNQIDDNDDNNDLEQDDDSAVVVDGSDGAGLDSGDSASGIKSGEENDSKSIIDNNGKTTHIKIIEIDANGGIGIKNNVGNRNIVVYIIALSIFSLFFAGFIYYFNLGEKMIEYKSYF